MPQPRSATHVSGKARLQPEDVLRVVQEEHGLLYPAADRLGVSRTVLRQFINARSNLVSALVECREALVDKAESGLAKLVEQGDFKAIQFVLITLGKDRGYALPKSITALENTTTNNYTVQTVNIVSVPPGHYLTAEDVAGQVIEHAAENAA